MGAAPHTAEARVKPAMPMRNRRRRPKMSPNRPPVMRVTAKANRYTDTISSTDAKLACRLAWMEGMATLTMLTSISCMKVADRMTGNSR